MPAIYRMNILPCRSRLAGDGARENAIAGKPAPTRDLWCPGNHAQMFTTWVNHQP